MAINQIPKNKSISFNEYIQGINTTQSSITSDWGFFVPLETNTHNIINVINYNDIDINEITETMFEMDCPTESKSPLKPNLISNIYTNIKSNLFIISSFILCKVSSVCLQ